MTHMGDPKGTRFDPANDPPPHEWTPDQLKPGDLQRGMSMLRDAADRGEPWAAAVLFELERRRELLCQLTGAHARSDGANAR